MNFKKYHVSKNVMPAGELKTVESNGVTFSSDGNGRYHISGTATEFTSVRFNLLSGFTTPISVSNGGQGTLSFFNTQSNNKVTLRFCNGTTIVDSWNQTPIRKTATAYNVLGNKYVDNVVITVSSGTTVDMTITPEFTNDGVLPSEFEPYSSEVWHDTPHYIHTTSTDTITTLPADIYVNDTTATVGLKGNMYQASGVSPDSPIMPQGTGERTGNLFDVNRLPSDTWTIDDKYYIDGAVGDSKSSIRPDTVDVSISNSGDLTVTARSYYGAGFVIPVTPNTTYTISFTADTAVPSSKSIATITYVNADEDFLNIITIYGGTTSVKFTTPNTAYYILITFRYASNKITYSDIMLNLGSTPLPYEKYGYKIPISSANTTTPVYLGEVETTRKIGKIDLGTLNWSKTASGNFWADRSIPNCRIVGNELIGNAICTHFTEVSANSVANTPYSFSSCLNSQARPFINKTGFENLTGEEFKQAMSGVYIYYVLATPETGIVNEPLRKIGDYADTVSGITIPTTTGKDTFDVLTTLKPSEVSLAYTGWHDASVGEWDGSQWQ